MNRIMNVLIGVAVVVALTPLLLIIGEVVYKGASVISLTFLFDLPTPVGVPGGGIGNAIEGSAVVVGIAALISVPLGVGAGIYFSEWPESKLSFLSSFMNDVLAGFPSITLGMFGYIAIVLTTGKFSAFAGSVALSIVMLPVIARTTAESLKIVPVALREASMALGIPRWKTVIRIVISTGRSGLVTGILLAVARAAGETAPLLLTIFGSNYYFNGNPFSQVSALPLLIYNYGTSIYPDWIAKAWGAALLLVVFMLVLNLSAKLLIGRRYAGVRAEI